MLEDDGNSADTVAHSITNDPMVKTFLTWIQGVILGLVILSILATKYLPHMMGTAVSSILGKVLIVVFICALPLLEVILWKLWKELPRTGYWGFVLLLVGVGILEPGMAIFVGIDMFVVTPAQPSFLMAFLLIVMCAAFALTLLGLLIVIVQSVRQALQLSRHRRQVRASGDQL